MGVTIIGPEAETILSWQGLAAALEAGHRRPPAQIGDTLLRQGENTLLSRSAWIEGLGIAVKSATIYPGNGARGVPSVNGSVALYTEETGELEAIVDFHLVTKWKTAGDSLLSATRLARADAKVILIVGAGTVARSMVEAYASAFPGAEFILWNRSPAAAALLARQLPNAVATTDLESAVRGADIIATATMSTEPLIRGAWLRPGTHLDLIGAYRPDMREVDDATIARARIFVDSRVTAIEDIGELGQPLAAGVISHEAVIADFYELGSGRFARTSDEEITLAKNGGGAHLDLMTARYVLDAWRAR